MRISSLHQGLKSFFLLSTFALTTAQAMEPHIRNPFDGDTIDNNGNKVHHFIPREPNHQEDRDNITLRGLDDVLLSCIDDQVTVGDIIGNGLESSVLGNQAELAYLIERFLNHPEHRFDGIIGRFVDHQTQNFFGNLLSASAYFLRGHNLDIPQGDEPRSLNIPTRDPHIVTKPTIDMLLYVTAMTRHYGSQTPRGAAVHAFSQDTMVYLFNGINPNGGSINPDLMGHLVSTAIFSKFFERYEGGNTLFRQVDNNQIMNANPPGGGTIGLLPEAKAFLGVDDQEWNAIDTTGALNTFQKQFKKTLEDRLAILDHYRQRVDEFKNRFVGGGDKGVVALSNQFNEPNFDPAQALSDPEVILDEARRVLHIPQNEEVLTGNDFAGLDSMRWQATYEEWRDAYFDPDNIGRAYVHLSEEPRQQFFIRNSGPDQTSFDDLWRLVSPLCNQGNNPTLQQIADAIRAGLSPSIQANLRDGTKDFFFVLPANAPQAATLGIVEIDAIGTEHYIGENKIGKAIHLLRQQLRDEHQHQLNGDQGDASQDDADQVGINQVNDNQPNVNNNNPPQGNIGNLQGDGHQLSQAAQGLQDFFMNTPYNNSHAHAAMNQQHILTRFFQTEYERIQDVIQQAGFEEIEGNPNDSQGISGFLDPRPNNTPLPTIVGQEDQFLMLVRAGEYHGSARGDEQYGSGNPAAANVLFTRLMLAIQYNHLNPNDLEALKNYIKTQINDATGSYSDFKNGIMDAQRQGKYFIFSNTRGNPFISSLASNVPAGNMLLRHGAAFYKTDQNTVVFFGDNKFGRLIQQVAKDFVEEENRQSSH